MQFGDILPRQRAALEQAIPAWRRDVGQVGTDAIRVAWPSPLWDDTHPYATGESYRGWSFREHEGTSITIVCSTPHSIYTERGYTFRGPETARSWFARDFGPYSDTALHTAGLRGLTDQLIRGALNG